METIIDQLVGIDYRLVIPLCECYSAYCCHIAAVDKNTPVVTNLNLSSSSVTSSSSTFLPGKKNPIILLKNWYISWMVRGTTLT